MSAIDVVQAVAVFTLEAAVFTWFGIEYWRGVRDRRQYWRDRLK